MHTSTYVRVTLVALVLLVAAGPAALALDSSVDVRNVAPRIKSASIAPFSPLAWTNVSVPVSVVVTDANGHTDIAGVSVTILRPDGSTVHIPTGAATRVVASGTESTWTYTFEMKYYDAPAVDGATYKVVAIARDAAGLTGDNRASVATFSYGEIVALSLGADALNFGSSLEPGAPSSILATPIHNRGNVRIDVTVTGSALAGPAGSAIGPSAVAYSTSPNLTAAQALSSSLQIVNSFDLSPGAVAARNLHWRLDVPVGLPAGAYAGSLTIEAVEG